MMWGSASMITLLAATVVVAAPTTLERPLERSPYRFHGAASKNGLNWVLSPSEHAPKDAPPMLVKFYRDETSRSSKIGNARFTLEIESPKKIAGSISNSRWMDESGNIITIPSDAEDILQRRQLGGKRGSKEGGGKFGGLGKLGGGDGGSPLAGLVGKLGGGEGGGGSPLSGLLGKLGDGGGSPLAGLLGGGGGLPDVGGLLGGLGGGALPDLGGLIGGGGSSGGASAPSIGGGITGAAGSIGENIGIRIGKSIGEQIGKGIGKTIGEYIGSQVSSALGSAGGGGGVGAAQRLTDVTELDMASM